MNKTAVSLKATNWFPNRMVEKCNSRHMTIHDVLTAKETRKIVVLQSTSLLSIFVFFRDVLQSGSMLARLFKQSNSHNMNGFICATGSAGRLKMRWADLYRWVKTDSSSETLHLLNQISFILFSYSSLSVFTRIWMISFHWILPQSRFISNIV